MGRYRAGGLVASVAAVISLSCGAEQSSDPAELGTARLSLDPSVEGNFSHVLRVNPAETTVRSRCELTVPLARLTPLTFIASEGGSLPTSVGWMGGPASLGGLSVTACVSYPCDVIAEWRDSSSNGSTLGCEIIADNGRNQLIGKSSGTALTVEGPPAAPVIFNQDMKIGTTGTAITGSCVFRQSAVLPGAEVTDLAVLVNGVVQVDLPGPALIGGVPWSQKGPAVPFGTLYIGSEPGATRLKHVAPRKEQLNEGDALRCDGRYYSASGAEVFDVNRTAPPPGSGMSLTRGGTGWTCDVAKFGAADGCDCNCGILDADCGDVAACAPCNFNGECSAAEFCSAASCGGAGECQPRPLSCSGLYAPVCGCDGVTYTNACEAAAAGARVDYSGVCLPPPCDSNGDCTLTEYCQTAVADCGGSGTCATRPVECTGIYNPVCGCDGVTYLNACEAAATGVSTAYLGECLPPPCNSNSDCAATEYCNAVSCGVAGTCEVRPTSCTGIFNPVCGCDNVTYLNACKAAEAGVRVAHAGAC